jgi:TPR repeat protein
VKSIKFLTLVAPLLGGCQFLGLLEGPAAPPAPSSAAIEAPAPAPYDTTPADAVALKTTPALAAEHELEREQVSAETRFGDAQFRQAQARALDGDANAAMRVARMYAEGSNGVPRDERAMVRWLKHASLLEHAGASYQLYLYYLARGLDRDAVRYERRALRQGYVLPVRLDNRRG